MNRRAGVEEAARVAVRTTLEGLYDIRGARGEENTTSASDMVALMREVRAGSALTRSSREFALGLLLDGRITSKIPVPRPPGARYAHKTGEFDGVENDAGLFILPGRSFALAVLVEGDVDRAVEPLSGALRAVCGFFAGTDVA